ncbi:MAG TPA: aspartate kinase [Prolixibacteraceae bacterium]|nr:aspartate kinase [Prolixibacteraceae bacterium]
MRVFKFGGASVKNAEGVKNLASIVSKSDGKLVVVVSAMGKMTNALEDLIRCYFAKDDKKWEKFAFIKDYHNSILDELFDSSDEVYSDVDSLYFHIEDRLDRTPSLDFDFEYDQLIGYGELISTRIVSAYLNKVGVKNQWVDIRFNLKTNDKWRDASVDWKLSEELIKKSFSFEEETIYLTQGFIGATLSDLTTSLGREGSDYTAAILGSILKADKVEIWKDVPGILNADPQYFTNPVKIDEMSYREAVELTFFGAKVIHPKTIKPLYNSKIPLHVRSFLDPEASGTIIGPEQDKEYLNPVPVFVMKIKQVLITLTQPDFSFMDEESLAWVFDIFSALNMKINLIQLSALNLSVSIDVPEHGILELIETLSEQFEVRYNDGLSLITIRHYTPQAIEKEIGHRRVYVEQRTRRIARFLVKHEWK